MLRPVGRAVKLDAWMVFLGERSPMTLATPQSTPSPSAGFCACNRSIASRIRCQVAAPGHVAIFDQAVRARRGLGHGNRLCEVRS